MIGATLDQPAVASAPDEVLMKHISGRRHEALAELYGRHSKRLRATIDGVVHEEAEADDGFRARHCLELVTTLRARLAQSDLRRLRRWKQFRNPEGAPLPARRTLHIHTYPSDVPRLENS